MTDQALEHDRLRDAVGLYVLEALEPAERAEFERHLPTCDECTAEVRSLRAVASALPHAVPIVDPPAALRNRVMAVARPVATPAKVVAMPPRIAAPPRPSIVSSGWLSAAALLVAAIGLGAYTLSLREQISGLRTELRNTIARLEQSEQQVTVATRNVSNAQTRLGVLLASDMTQVNLEGQPAAPSATGRAFWSRSRGLVFTASNLPPLPTGRGYQLWLVTAQAPVSAGMLQLDNSGSAAQSFDTPADIAQPVAVAVTIEPEAGVPAPTGDKYLVGLTH